ncbi:MAG TPA: hypothetical protein VEF33_05435 [Syntrophales bacterium]|nr:hypothetical protein [Syntrophales bacterium]
MKTNNREITVFITSRESTCTKCGEKLGSRTLITYAKGNEALCLECAALDHLVFLPAGINALIRRAKKSSNLHAVVFKWARKKKRYERQGLLVEEAALEQAEAECLSNSYGNRLKAII